jgi:hypothetical protein
MRGLTMYNEKNTKYLVGDNHMQHLKPLIYLDFRASLQTQVHQNRFRPRYCAALSTKPPLSLTLMLPEYTMPKSEKNKRKKSSRKSLLT